MPQHDMDVSNSSAAAVRSDFNGALQALATVSSGPTAPPTTYPYQFWADTTAGVLRQRNAANTAWIVRAPLAETLVVARAANTVLGVGDWGRSIIATGTWTQTLAAASTLGDGWYIDFRNNGTGTITIDPNGSETIDGATTIQLAPGENCFILCNGVAFFTIGRTASDIQRQIATAFTSAGAAPAFTLTPVPAITAYAAGQRFRCKFHAAGTTGSNTLNVSGLGAKSLKQYDATGAKVAAVVAASQLADVEYDGVDFVVLDPLPAAKTKGADVASSASVDLGVSDYVTITGVETILGFVGMPAGVEREVRFAGSLTLTHSASLFLSNDGANILTSVNDVARFRSEGGGAWRCVGYVRANGAALVASGPFTLEFASGQQSITSGGSVALSHGFPVAPKLVTAELVFVANSNSYTAGNVVQIATTQQSTDAHLNCGVNIEKNASTIFVRFGSNPNVFMLGDKSNGVGATIPNANVRLVVRAFA